MLSTTGILNSYSFEYSEHPATYYEGGNEGDRGGEDRLHLVLAGFGGGARQEVTHMIKNGHKLFLKGQTVLGAIKTSKDGS